MRPRALFRIAAGVGFLVAAAATATAQAPLPALTGRVVDEAGLLSSADEERLTTGLAALEQRTSVQLVIATVPSLEEPIEDFAIRLAESWGIGQAEDDNGILLLVSLEDRAARIEVGYGLEAAIPDGLAGRILREELAPHFQRNDYAAGFEAAAGALALAASGEYAAAPPEAARRRAPRSRFGLWLVVGRVALQLLGALGNAVRPAVAGTAGGVLAGGAGFAAGGLTPMLLLLPLGFLAGLLATSFVRGASDRRSGWGYHGVPGGGGAVWVPGSRGGFGAGFSGGGGGFGAGFVGGGGGFGGGGASGSW